MKRVVLFCRVSSTNDRQNYDRQINDLTQLATTLNYQVEAVFAGVESPQPARIEAGLEHVAGLPALGRAAG